MVKRNMFTQLAKRSTAVTAVSKSAKELLTELTGLDPDRAHVIDNGVDCELFAPCSDAQEKASLRLELDLPTNGLLFCCVAGLRRVKGHRTLVHAFAEAEPSRDVYLVLVGTGPEEEELKRLTQRLGLAEKVLFLGLRHDISALLKSMDAFVLNSETEGLSYAVLEAMASGLPVIATNVGANPELIETGKQGWLYPVHQASELVQILSRIASNPEILEPMGISARITVKQRFDFQHMAQKYAQLYENVFNSRTHAGEQNRVDLGAENR
jgi:glycosyltransferase involved in cell wall biosynthesis